MKHITKIGLLIFLLAETGLSFAASYPAQVPVTGETAGAAGSGSGVAWPNPRFVVGRGATANCVTDELTGLMWVRNLDTVIIKNSQVKGSATTWQNALDSIAQANATQGYCGYNDWRLPNIRELKSLINYSQKFQGSWLNTQGFINVQTSNAYWSSTSAAWNTNEAWWISDTGVSFPDDKNGLDLFVWPVRGGR